MSDFGGEQVQRTRQMESDSDTYAEHEIHAQNDENPAGQSSEVLGREKLCLYLFGGGIVPTTKSDGGFLSSPKDRQIYYITLTLSAC